MRAWVTTATLLVPVVLGLVGCRSKTEQKSAAVATPSASSKRLPAPQRRSWGMPSGPVLEVLPGRGVGPIRIGATVQTIERLMELPCDVSTPEVCRYIGRGVEFLLENGVTKTIHVHRAGRPAGKDKTGQDAEYGFFNGIISPDLQLGMIPSAIQEYLGQPKEVQSRAVQGAALDVEVHRYDGMRIEYDRLPNGNLVMGGILIMKEPVPSAPTSASAAPAPTTKPLIR